MAIRLPKLNADGSFVDPQVNQRIADIAKANGVPAGGAAGQVLGKNSTGATAWIPAPTSLPSGGTAGQAVVKQSDGSAAWGTVTGAPGRGIKSVVSSTTDPTKATITYTDNTTEVITLPTGAAGAAGKSIKSFGAPDPTTGVSTVTFSDNTTTTITLPKGPKGDAAVWSKDAQAKAQGYWIVVSPTAPTSSTYTTADGTVVPVIWQKPIEVMVPVIPEAPYFDKYALSIQVADLVGVDYYLTGFTKDGATVDVPDVKIPDGGILKLAGVPGKPELPYTVNVEAKAEPGYKLPSTIAWTYSVVDPKQVQLLTSDTFTGRATDPSPLYNTNTDAALGGVAKLWDVTWEPSAGVRDRVFTVAGGALKVDLTAGRAAVGIKGVGFNQKVEFDLTLSSDAMWGGNSGDGLHFNLATNGPLGGTGRFTLIRGGSERVNFTPSLTGMTLPKRSAAEVNGHYSIEIFESSLIVSVPGMAPATSPITRTFDATKTWFNIETSGGTAGTATLDNLKLSTIGF